MDHASICRTVVVLHWLLLAGCGCSDAAKDGADASGIAGDAARPTAQAGAPHGCFVATSVGGNHLCKTADVSSQPPSGTPVISGGQSSIPETGQGGSAVCTATGRSGAPNGASGGEWQSSGGKAVVSTGAAAPSSAGCGGEAESPVGGGTADENTVLATGQGGQAAGNAGVSFAGSRQCICGGSGGAVFGGATAGCHATTTCTPPSEPCPRYNAEDCSLTPDPSATPRECVISVQTSSQGYMGMCDPSDETVTLYVKWQPPDGSTTASAMISVNGTQTSTVDFAAPGTQSSILFVKRCLFSTHSTCEPGAAIWSVIEGSGDAATVTLSVGERTVECENATGGTDVLLTGCRLNYLDSTCGWVVVPECQTTHSLCTATPPIFTATELDVEGAAAQSLQSVSFGSSELRIYPGYAFRGDGPWAIAVDGLACGDIARAPVVPLECQVTSGGPPAPEGAWATACADDTPEPVFSGEPVEGCPVGCPQTNVSVGFLLGGPDKSCYCDFQATWAQALQHCRSGGTILGAKTTSIESFQEIVANYDGWVGGEVTNGVYGEDCPAGVLPDTPDECVWITKASAQNTATGYVRTYERSDCRALKAFWCLVAE